MLMTPPDGGYWIQNGEHDSARSEDGIWRAPEIDTEHFTIEMDTVANVYRKYFKGQVSRYAICKLCPFFVGMIKALVWSSVKLLVVTMVRISLVITQCTFLLIGTCQLHFS